MAHRRKLSLGILSCFGSRNVNSHRKTIDPSMIGCPTEFRHTQHMGGSSEVALSGNIESVAVPANTDSSTVMSNVKGRFIDLAQLKNENFDLEKLSCHFRGPGIAKSSVKSSVGVTGTGDSDITHCFLASDTVDLSGIAFSDDNDVASCMSSSVCCINNVNIHYECVGHGSHTVLLIPGGLGTPSIDFGMLFHGEHALDPDIFTIVAVTLPGYGYSRPPDRQWPSKYMQYDADILSLLMKRLNWSKYSIIAWSDGGRVALLMAASNGALVDKIVIWGSSAYLRDTDIPILQFISDANKWKPRVRAPYVNIYGTDYFSKLCHDWMNAYINYPGGVFVSDKSLANIKANTLIVHGAKDCIISTFHAKYLHSHIFNSDFVLWPNAAHDLHMRYPEEFLQLVQSFLLS